LRTHVRVGQAGVVEEVEEEGTVHCFIFNQLRKMMMTQTAHPHHLLPKTQKPVSDPTKKESVFVFLRPVATLINLETKPFPVTEPIPAAENPKMQQPYFSKVASYKTKNKNQSSSPFLGISTE
jgi:hypothetical protein